LKELHEKYEAQGPSRLVRKLDLMIEAHKVYKKDFKCERQPVFMMSKK